MIITIIIRSIILICFRHQDLLDQQKAAREPLVRETDFVETEDVRLAVQQE